MLPSTNLVRFCQHHNIQVVAFSPLGQQSYLSIHPTSHAQKSLLQADEVKAIASAHGKTAAQVLLRWSVQRGVAAVPKSTNAQRLKENLDVFNFALSEQEMEALTNFSKGVYYRFNDPCPLSIHMHGTLLLLLCRLYRRYSHTSCCCCASCFRQVRWSALCHLGLTEAVGRQQCLTSVTGPLLPKAPRRRRGITPSQAAYKLSVRDHNPSSPPAACDVKL